MRLRPFGDALANYRRAIGLSQTELAERANLSVSYLRKLEQGSTEPSGLAIMNQLAAALRVDPRMLIGPTPSMSGRDIPQLHELTACALVDRELVLHSTTDEWERLLPGARTGTSFAAWFFTDPRARLVVEDWRALARGVIWWLIAAGDLVHPDNLALQRIPEYTRLASSTYHPGMLSAFDPGGLSLRDWDTRQVKDRTLHVFQDPSGTCTLLAISTPAS